jgi:hypothetical protein
VPDSGITEIVRTGGPQDSAARLLRATGIEERAGARAGRRLMVATVAVLLILAIGTAGFVLIEDAGGSRAECNFYPPFSAFLPAFSVFTISSTSNTQPPHVPPETP